MKKIFMSVTVFIFVVVICWIIFSLYSFSNNQRVINSLPDKDLSFYTFAPIVLSPVDFVKYTTTCSNGYTIEVATNITSWTSSPVWLGIFLPTSVQKIKIFSNSGNEVFSQWLDNNLKPQGSFLFQKSFYEEVNMPSDLSQLSSKTGYHIVLPASSSISEVNFNSIVECLEDSGLVELGTIVGKNFEDGSFSAEYVGDVKYHDPSKILVGISSITLLKN